MDAIAITWGAWSSNGRLRAGIEYFMSPSSVGSGTSSVDILCRLWMQTRYASDESGGGSTPWTMTGSIARSGSGGGWSLAAMGTKLLTAQNSTFSTSFSFASTVTVTGKFTSSFAYPGTAPTVTASIVIPKRPYAVPAAPSGVTGTRNSDTQATVAWTRNVTTVAPYVSHTLQMRTFTGSAWGAWSTIASPTGTVTT